MKIYKSEKYYTFFRFYNFNLTFKFVSDIINETKTLQDKFKPLTTNQKNCTSSIFFRAK